MATATKQKLALIGRLAEETREMSVEELAEKIGWELEMLAKKIEHNLQDKVELKAKDE